MPSLLDRHGFRADPFEFTNAEQEEFLTDYFVPPPYFASVLGEPDRPRSHIVLAPRGGGKTAQRLMVEQRSREGGGFLCVKYDTFDQPRGFRPSDASWAYHINQVCRLILLGILLTLEDLPERAEKLTVAQKSILKYEVEHFLGSLSEQEIQTGINSIKSFGDRAKDLWNRYGGPVATVIEAILRKAQIADVSLPDRLPDEAKADESARFHFTRLLEAAKAIGYRSVYVLVDKIDEMDITTTDANAAYVFIRPLVNDLPTLDAAGVAFKFFLWDRIEEDYRSGGGRPDRIEIFNLKWNVGELEKMLGARLHTYSEGRIDSLNDLMCPDTAVDLHRLAAFLAAGSPRDMIRMASRIVAEQTRVTDDTDCIQLPSVWAGIRKFSDERSEELLGSTQMLAELRRIGAPTFTVNRLANDIFRISTQAARSKVQKWMNTGLVSQIGEVPNPGNRPQYLYGAADPRLAIAMLPGVQVDEILRRFAYECPSCQSVQLTSQTEQSCTGCGTRFSTAEAVSLLGSVSGRPLG